MIQKTAADLRKLAETHKHVLVGYSGGKDSLVVTDLCVKTFKKVSAFHMYFIPGLGCIETQMAYAKTRWGLDVARYPHWVLFKALKGGTYCDLSMEKDEMPELSLHDLYTIALHESGASLLATGARNADSLWRRRFFRNTAQWGNMVYPIREWNKFDVLTYLRINGIPIPDSSKGNATGVDLSTQSLLWLHDRHPEDFKKLCQWFPEAPAVVYRREFFGIQ